MKEEERPTGSYGVCHSLPGWAKGTRRLERGNLRGPEDPGSGGSLSRPTRRE